MRYQRRAGIPLRGHPPTSVQRGFQWELVAPSPHQPLIALPVHIFIDPSRQITYIHNVNKGDEPMQNVNEILIARRIIEDALFLGYQLSVYDGEETTVHKSTDFWEIYGALGTTDYDAIRFYADNKLVGSVALIWGNDTDIIHDWTDNKEIDRLMRGPFQTAAIIDRELNRY